MTARLVSITSTVAPAELALVDAASQNIATALTEASGEIWQVSQVSGSPEAFDSASTIVLTSFGPEVAIDEPWTVSQARLRACYERWGRSGAPVFICTVLRHVAEPDPAESLRRLVRIRRLNLLATRISHETGAFVIDLDRALADVGAHRLATDYRLESEAARDQAAACIARSIIANGLDQLATFDVQDKASAIMARYQPVLGLPTQLRPQQLLSIGRGRRQQIAAVEAVSPEQRHLFLIRQVLTRQIGVGTATVIFVRAVRHVGFRKSIQLLAGAARRLLGMVARP